MQNFSGLKQLRALSAIVLMACLLLIGSALATPMVSDKTMQSVCTGMGMKLVAVASDDEPQDTLPGGFDCPLCFAGISFIPPSAQVFLQEAGQAAVVLATDAVPTPSERQSRWQARAPPTFL